MEYKNALKLGFYDFEIARNWYRSVCNPENGGPGMHRDLVFSFIRNSALLLTPFTPHYSEHVWRNILGEKTSIQNALFPKPSGPLDTATLAQLEYMRGVVDRMRSAEATLARRKGKKGASTASYDPSKPKAAKLYVANEFPDWQNKCVEIVRKSWDGKTVDDGQIRELLAEQGMGQDKKDKKTMPFIQTFKVSSDLSFHNASPLTRFYSAKSSSQGRAPSNVNSHSPSSTLSSS